MPNQKQVCENCRFFDRTGSENKGECLRYPPQASHYETIISAVIWRFPEVHQADHCGEWRPILESGNISAYDDE